MSEVHKRIQAVCKEYETSLEDLTFNSRVLIQSLTLLADKLKVYAPYIVQIVEKRITKVPPEQKLSVLYLLDSIMKNLGGEYLQLFCKNIVATFCHTFETASDVKKKQSLFKLRQTWNTIIPLRKLVAIDKHVHSIDSNWPVVPEPPSTPQSPTIFVNPKFVKADGELITSKPEDKKYEEVASAHEQARLDESRQGDANIQEQRKALLEQQRQKRVEGEKKLGLHSSKANISSSETTLKPSLNVSKSSKGVSSNGSKRVRFLVEEKAGPQEKKPKEDNCLAVNTNQETIGHSPSPIHIRPNMLDFDDLPEERIPMHHDRIKQQTTDNPLQAASSVDQSDARPDISNVLEQANKAPMNVSDLLSKLVQTGLLPQQQQQQQPKENTTVTQAAKPAVDEHLPPAIRVNPKLRIPDLHLHELHLLRQFYPELVDLLYAGDQCSQCGLRFTGMSTDEYSNHLDWHFELNRKDKGGLRKTSRNWFLHPEDWYSLKEGEQIEDKAKSNIFEQESLEDEQKIEEGDVSCKVLPGEGSEACHLCGESFEQFWEEDLEEWHFKDAVRTPEGVLYHVDCRREAKENEVPQTPITPTAGSIIPQEEFEKARTTASTADINR